jgi:uncharacterized membrane protein
MQCGIAEPCRTVWGRWISPYIVVARTPWIIGCGVVLLIAKGVQMNKPNEAMAQTGAPITARTVAQGGMIAALYAACTLLTISLLGGLAWGPVQLRLSEAICVLALLTRPAVPGLTIGCVLANLLAIALTGSGAMGMLDVIFGSLATLIGALWAWKFRKRTALALAGPVVANALIVPAYLPLILAASGFYTIPFTNIDLVSSYPLMYLFGVLATGVGEALVIYCLGWPLLNGLRRINLFNQNSNQN